MNVQGFLFAHGEKLLLGLVVVICALALYGTVSAEDTKSKANLAEINEVVAKLERAYQTPGRPNLAPTRAFEEEIKTRFQLQVSAEPVIAGLTTKPDVTRGGDIGGERRLYAYEIVTPEVRIEDVVGSLNIDVRVPEGPRPDGAQDFIVDAPGGASWTRQEPKRGDVTNLARHVGVLLEYRIFRDGMGVKDGWEPLVTDHTPNGVLPLQGGHGQVTMRNVEPWQTYDVRGRLLVAATGTVSRDDEHWKIGKEVVLFERALPISPPPRTWAQAQEQIQVPFMDGRFDKFLAQRYDGPAPTGPALLVPVRRQSGQVPEGMPGGPGMPGPGAGLPRPRPAATVAADLPVEHFLGAPSDFASVQTQASIYLGLKRASGGVPGFPASATIIAKRLVKDEDGKDLGWTPAVEYKVQESEAVGKLETLDVPWGSIRLPIDLSTPFVVEKIEKDVKRIWYYEVREKNVQTEDGFQKQLVVEPREKTTDVVVLANTKDDDARLRLVQFAKITPPFAGRWSYPAIPEGGIDEEEIFKKAPLQWRNPDLVPREPILHHDLDLLAKLIPLAQAQLATLPYVEMPDGRVIYYYEPEKRALVQVIPDSEWDQQGAPKALGQPAAPAGDRPGVEAGTVPPEPGPGGYVPPGGTPGGYIPPGGADQPPPPEGGRRRR